tara:strand:+ start:3169 stop:4497 length:1329 start_codon:yes stop_codon:yes gene_type:complete
MFRPIIRKQDILIPNGSYVSNIEPPTINNEFKTIVEQSNSDSDNYNYQEEINSDDDSVISSITPSPTHSVSSHKKQDFIEFHLPNNDIIREFSTYSNSNKTKIIELGLATLNTTNDKRLEWNNKNVAVKINQIKNNHKKEIENLQHLIDSMKKEITNIKSFNKKEMENQKISIQDRLDSTYKTDIDYKNKQIQQLRDNEKELRKWLHTIKDEQILKIQELNNTHNKDVKEIHNKYQQERNDSIHSKLDQMVKNVGKAVVKGDIGEIAILEQCNKDFPHITWNKVGNEKGGGKCDIVGNGNIAIEVKNYDTSIRKKEIDKFRKDMKNNKDYKAGLFISLNKVKMHDKPDCHIELLDGKPLMYINNVAEDITKLKASITVLYKLLELGIDLEQATKFDKVITLIKDIDSHRADIQKKSDDYNNKLNTTLGKLGNTIQNAINFLT